MIKKGSLYVHNLGFNPFYNNAKSKTFWIKGKGQSKPHQTQSFSYTWAPQDLASKLLVTIFGLSLNSTSVNKFLFKKVQNKLKYWFEQPNFYGLGRQWWTIINSIFLLSLWYLVSIWVRTKQGISKVKRLLSNYLWVRWHTIVIVEWHRTSVVKEVHQWPWASGPRGGV